MASEDKESGSQISHGNSINEATGSDVAALQIDMNKLSLDVVEKPSSPDQLCSEIKEKEKFLLILDLNGLLIHRAHRASRPNNRTPDAVFANKMVYKRPYCEEFMRFCLEHFQVALWSSAMEHNVDAVLKVAFGELKSKLLFVWSQTKCSDYGFKSVENSRKPLFFKELKKVWEGGYQQFRNTKTLLMDDSPSKAILNPPNTGIYLDSYDPENMNDNALDPNGELASYLKGLCEEAEKVPSYVASHPFGRVAITPNHPHWNFYCRVLRLINTNEN